MEAKVDVRKLQILNDRINQTIDALSQVRMSVHGLGHTGVPTKMMNPFGTIGFPGYPPTYPSFLGIPPVPPTPVFPPVPGMLGLSHTPFTPFVNPLFNVPGPFTAPVTPPIPTPGITPSWGVPPTPWFGTGLFHSTPDPIDKLLDYRIEKILENRPILEKIIENRAFDPYRLMQTFPYISLY